ncbi:MAG TPA: hypothetical protein VGD41_14890, partial [Pyrinomonadaceae bacterium]
MENENTAQAKEAYSYGYSTPDYLLPKMDGVSVSEPAFYKSLYILGTLHENTSDGQLEALDKPVDPFETRASGNAEIETRPAFGVLTVHRQSWVQRGIALGNVIQSVCLAPGEVTQVAVIDWRRQTSGTSTDTDEQGEAVTSAIDQQRAVNEVQQAVAREAQSGRSSTSASSASTQASLSGASLMLSGSTAAAAATSTALTAQFSTGARNLAAQSSNALSQRTAERSSALRSRRSTVVREVSEHETETLSTRVLVNYNRRHTLNVEYFEVLQLYALTTKLHSWERCLFVPLKPIDFNLPEQIVKHRVSLQAIFESLGRSDLIARLVSDFNTAKHADSLDLRIKALEQEISNDEAESRVHADVVKACTEALGALQMYQQGASRPDSSGEPFKRAALSTYRKISDAHREDFPADLLAARDDDLKANQTERALKRDIANGRAVGRRQDLSKIKAERFA